MQILSPSRLGVTAGYRDASSTTSITSSPAVGPGARESHARPMPGGACVKLFTGANFYALWWTSDLDGPIIGGSIVVAADHP
jgi:hypothetical protein